MLTETQAYVAMFQFLEKYCHGDFTMEIGGILGSMSLLSDGSPADPAVSQEWKRAVKFSLDGGSAGQLKLSK